ncbi:hypothetical protein CVT26_003105 [Gymnopilus dilepis]|uniref:F-box domain-containing protein n=1 Tax=Gymnopilus dilepis TaxID=231916 RepID=A0A409Y4P0_9AGAR|nr:hypothetical protein CVT26_003105 [Gymnopilus dilepis]
MDVLPIEAIQLIFKQYTHGKLGSESPWILGAICREWRTIAWSDPNIWSHPYFPFYTPHRIAARVNLAIEWLQRSGDLPLTICLTCNDYWTSEIKMDIAPLIDLINQISGRWYSLDLSLPEEILACVDASCSSSILHELYITTCDSHGSVADQPRPVRDFSQHAPRRVKIFQRQGKLLIVSLNWKNVTSLNASPLSIDELLYILSMSPTLRHCQCACDARIRGRRRPISADKHVLNPMVEFLEISFGEYGGGEVCFLDDVTLPGLKQLHLVMGGYEGWETLAEIAEHLEGFLIRSNANLETFNAYGSDFSDDDVVRLLELMPTLTELRVSGDSSCFSAESFFAAFSRHLRHDDDEDTEPEAQHPILPLLRTFSCYAKLDFSSWGLIPEMLCPLSEDDSGHRRPLERIEVSVSDSIEVDIDHKNLAAIKEDDLARLAAISELVELKLSGQYYGNMVDWYKHSVRLLGKPRKYK